MATHLEIHELARALGVPDAEEWATCAVCGASPFGPGARIPDSFGDLHALARPDLSVMCAGCTRALGGRPGDDPPPPRTVSLLYIEDELRVIDRDAMWDALLAPPASPFLLSWARSKKKHHVLYARWSTAEHYRIGCDGETIDYVPARDVVLVEAVLELVRTHTRAAIREGVYHASRVAEAGAGRHAMLEAVVSTYRRGRPALLDLLLWCAPKTERSEEEEALSMIDPRDDRAAHLLGAIAYGSTFRVERGIQFWGGFYAHQVERFKRRPLAQFCSRLMETTQVETTRASTAVELLRALDEAETRDVEESIRERTTLVVALAFEHAKQMKEDR